MPTRLGLRLLLVGLFGQGSVWAGPLRYMPFAPLRVPKLGAITHVTGEAQGRVWMLSEQMDVLVVEGRNVRKIRNGSWAHIDSVAGPFRFFEASGIAAVDSALILAGSNPTMLGNSFAALARLPLAGKMTWWSNNIPSERLTAPVVLGAVAKSSETVEWASGAQTLIGFLHPNTNEVVLAESPSHVFIARENLVQAFDGWTWKSFEASATVVSLWFDGKDALWVLTTNGAERLDDGTFTAIALPPGLGAVRVKGTSPDRVWFFGPGSLALYDGHEVISAATPIHEVRDLWQAKNRTTYFVGANKDGAGVATVLPARVL